MKLRPRIASITNPNDFNGSQRVMPIEENRSRRAGRLLCWAAGFCSLCFGISVLTMILLLTLLIWYFQVPIGLQPFSIGGIVTFLASRSIVPALTVLGEMLKSFSPWGLIVLLAICVVLWGPEWIREAITSSKWEFSGIKFEGATSSISFRKDLSAVERIAYQTNKELAEAYSSAHEFARQLRERNKIEDLMGPLTREIVNLIGSRCPPDFRLTLYVPDFVFSDRLYQFTEYYNREGEIRGESRFGRTFSIRYGIIGRVWRSGVPEIEGQLIPQSEIDQLPNPSQEELERFIARRWGLSLSEAIHVKDYNSYGAIRLERAGRSVGLIYFDSKQKDAFCDPEKSKELENGLVKMLGETQLLVRLLEISNEVAPWSGRIQFLGNSRPADV
jgi:Sec-independent protein translocase protein TatA